MPKDEASSSEIPLLGDVVFMDYCEIKHMAKKHQLFLVLDGATSLLWGATQQEGTEPVTQDLFRERKHIRSCKPRWVVADMALFTPSWMTSGRLMVSRRCQLEEPLLGQTEQRQQEDSWCQDDANWKSHSLAKQSRDSSTTLQEAV